MDENNQIEMTYCVQDIKLQFSLISGLNVHTDLIADLDFNLTFSQEHKLVGDISIFENDTVLCISFHFQVANDLINDIAVQISKVMEVTQHESSKLHFFVLVIIDN